MPQATTWPRFKRSTLPISSRPCRLIAFSLAQAHRRQYFVDHAREHLQRSIALFRQYVELAPTGSRRADALDALSQLEPLAAAQPKAPSPSQPTRTQFVVPACWSLRMHRAHDSY